MPELRVEDIAPLIQSRRQVGRVVTFIFRCPVTGNTVKSTTLSKAKKSTLGRRAGKSAARSAKSKLFGGLRSAVGGAIQDSLGAGLLGGAASAASHEVTGSAERKVNRKIEGKSSGEHNGDEVVAAFKKVADQFRWDEKKDAWVSAKTPDKPLRFLEIITQCPVKEKYDQSIVARMMTEVAKADGSISDDEKAYLEQYLPEEFGNVVDLLAKPDISEAEFGEVSQGGVRYAMILMTWGLALSGESLAAEENAKIAAYAKHLAIEPKQAAELRFFAQEFVLAEAMESVYPDNRKDDAAYAEVRELAKALGVPDKHMEMIDVRHRKRNGIF